jgi:predicted nucleic acid-binding protein
MILFDTSVVIDCRDAASPWHAWAKERVADAVSTDEAGINAVAVAESGVRAANRAELNRDLEALGFRLLPLPVSAARPAAAAFATYLDRCKAQGVARASQTPLPDFLIGAHCEAEGLALVTRDPERVRSYFPRVKLITP